MKTFRLRLVPLAVATLACVAAVPLQKKAKKPPARTVAGTAQLPGDDGKLGQAYTMGKENRLNLVLTGVRYSKTRWNHGNDTAAPNQGQKLLIVSFQVQNPNKAITRFGEGTLKLTAIDGEGANHEGEFGVVQKGRNADFEIDLKPAQRVEAETAILVPAAGPIPKLMVAHRSGGSVVRYDLRGHVAPLGKPFSPNGVDAPASVTGEAGVAYPLLKADVTIGATAFKAGRFGDLSEREGQTFMTTRLTLVARTPGRLAFQIHGQAVDGDGERYPSIDLQKASTEAESGGIGEPGEPLACRMLFFVPKGVKIAKVRVWEGDNDLRSTTIEAPVGLYATEDGRAPKTGAASTPARR